MARCIVMGSVAVDECYQLTKPMRRGAHLDARPAGRRLGGGGANTAVSLARAGHDVVLASVVGRDEEAGWLRAELGDAGVDVSRVRQVDGPSTRSLVLVDPDGERTIVNVHRCTAPALLDGLDDVDADAVYVRSREADVAPALARRLGSCLVVAHLPPTDPLARPAHVLVASESDLLDGERGAPRQLGERVAGESLRWIVLTRGAAGARAYGTGGARLETRAPHIRVVDSTGAGDVFTAGLLHALLSGSPMEAALRQAVSWGAATVAVSGLPSRERFAELV